MQPICKRAKEKNWPRWFCRRSRLSLVCDSHTELSLHTIRF